MKNTFSKYENIYESFKKRLSKTNKKELLYKLFRNLLYSLIIFFTIGFILIVLEAIFKYDSNTRMFFFWGFVSTFSTTLIYFLLNYLLKRFHAFLPAELIRYSRIVGNNFESIKDTLANSLSLYGKFKLSPESNLHSSKELIHANLDHLDSTASGINFSSFVSYKKLKKLAITLTVSVLFYTLSFLIFPTTLLSSVNRIINYEYNFLNNEYGIIFEISPGDIEIPKDSDVEITIMIRAN